MIYPGFSIHSIWISQLNLFGWDSLQSFHDLFATARSLYLFCSKRANFSPNIFLVWDCGQRKQTYSFGIVMQVPSSFQGQWMVTTHNPWRLVSCVHTYSPLLLWPWLVPIKNFRFQCLANKQNTCCVHTYQPLRTLVHNHCTIILGTDH